ncbi:hypothetical protein FAGAP_6594 [Fusarium agapanthi]|uniref:Uncharacterized protein n=1 Tax=Fusarium agapanthi TaxID=1803897 RepID=A0A9P5EDU5_9HYPO|nr:hypothetical protein FAGAP_6594 [Fusarium agapanthi]
MSDHALAFSDLESAAFKEMYPDEDDTRLLKRFQANWSKYHKSWDTNTKKDLLGFINNGDVKTNDTNRYPSGHKSWMKVELTWAHGSSCEHTTGSKNCQVLGFAQINSIKGPRWLVRSPTTGRYAKNLPRESVKAL